MRISMAMLAIAMMCFGSVAAKEKVAPVYELQATGTIQIGPDGQVAEYTLDKGQPAAIENALGRSIQQWRFEPILVDGTAVIAKTRMRLSIEALPTPGEDYQLRVGGVWFGEPDRSRHHMAPPSYPESAAREGMGAKAVLVLKLDAQGRVEQVHVQQVSLDSAPRPSGKADRWRDLFAHASVTAAKQWHFEISEMVDGNPVPTSVKVPVEFFLTDGPRPNLGENTWRRYIPGPQAVAPWIGDSAVAAEEDVDQLKDGDVRSLASHFQLKDAVVGSLL